MIGQLIEQLQVANQKLFVLCDKKAAIVKNPKKFKKKEIVELIRQDLALCFLRGRLKSEIDKKLSEAIINGDLEAIEEVKKYG